MNHEIYTACSQELLDACLRIVLWTINVKYVYEALMNAKHIGVARDVNGTIRAFATMKFEQLDMKESVSSWDGSKRLVSIPGNNVKVPFNCAYVAILGSSSSGAGAGLVDFMAQFASSLLIYDFMTLTAVKPLDESVYPSMNFHTTSAAIIACKESGLQPMIRKLQDYEGQGFKIINTQQAAFTLNEKSAPITKAHDEVTSELVNSLLWNKKVAFDPAAVMGIVRARANLTDAECTRLWRMRLKCLKSQEEMPPVPVEPLLPEAIKKMF
jgi:hypothetical protein